MPKFARSNSYTSREGNQSWTGEVRFANQSEATQGTNPQLAISPLTLAGAIGTLVPDASTTVKGILELATNAEAVTGTDALKAVVPASLTARLAAPGAIGGTTPGAGSFTALSASTGYNGIVGGVTPAAGTFTALGSSGATSLATGAGVAAALGNATGTVGFFGSAGATSVTQGAITNSVTSGGSANVIADYSDLTVYANDSAAIRDDIYQLAAILTNVVGALRSYGLLV